MSSPDFERLCERNYDRIARAAFLILGDRHEALDVAQETFARAHARWAQVGSMQNPEGWLLKVATNLSISTRRRAARRILGGAPDRADIATEPSDPALAEALGILTPAQRAAIVLRFYLDLSIEDAARTLGKRPGTVRALTSQGVARLRDHLGEEAWEVRHE
jgi:RNA polymerase sigma factor (sigma-70 family)